MKLISVPSRIDAVGNLPKLIEEFFGRVNSGNPEISIARMRSPVGWVEPAQTPQFDEFTVVLNGRLLVETKNGNHEINKNQAIVIHKGEWVRYSSPFDGGAEYISVCIPAFSPELVNRDKE